MGKGYVDIGEGAFSWFNLVKCTHVCRIRKVEYACWAFIRWRLIKPQEHHGWVLKYFFRLNSCTACEKLEHTSKSELRYRRTFSRCSVWSSLWHTFSSRILYCSLLCFSTSSPASPQRVRNLQISSRGRAPT
jgi:hypothetical protein